MFSRFTKEALVAMITDQALADEIERRLFLRMPVTKSQAVTRLATLTHDAVTQQEILNRLVWDLAGSGAEGAELAQKIVGMIRVLVEMSAWVKAAYTGTPTGCATAVTAQAAHVGVDGNLIVLSFDGSKTIAQVVTAWNAAHATNQITITVGNDAQTPSNGQAITLTGGGGDIATWQAAVGTSLMSSPTYAILIDALASEPAASEFRTQYNLMVAGLQSIVVP